MKLVNGSAQMLRQRPYLLPLMMLISCPAVSIANPSSPLVIAHRGASGYVPEHSQRAYELALAQQADVIELDLVVSQDQQLLIRHENELSLSTNVATRAEFQPRKTTKIVDGIKVTGWFAEDFTLKELQSLKLRETKPQVRPQNTQWNDQWPLLSLTDFLEWNQISHRYDVYMELKHPTYFQYQAAPFHADLAELLRQALLQSPLPSAQRLYLQSFEATPLQRWHAWRASFKFPITLVQLLGDVSAKKTSPTHSFEQPWDWVYQHGKMPNQATTALPTYADMVTPAGLRLIASYADAIGPWRDNLYPYAGGPVTPWLQQATQLKLKVHPYTLRVEAPFRQTDPQGKVQSLCQELTWLMQQPWLDGVFTDQPDVAVKARQGQCELSQ